jgi:splicing factor 1
MARDCPDRQKGASWRNGPTGPAAGRVGAGNGDAVDREMEVGFCSFSISLPNVF